MADRDGYPPGVPCWIDTTQPDPDAAAEFYRGLFGWEVEDVMPPGSDGKYYMARIRGRDVAAIGSPLEGAPQPAAWNTYVCVESADETAQKVSGAGGRVLVEPFDVLQAGRTAVFSDPEGAVFSAWQPLEHKGAVVVNEHGSLNFNVLNTRDVEGAEAFYGAVFGWELGADESMWLLAGYGDHLEERDPGLRERIASFGGPPRFEDVVAALTALTPVGDDQADTPAYWGVTFAVDDADAAAERAEELGAELTVPPTDAPWTRLTVIRDPQGATFVASQFVPENKDLDG